MAKYNNVSINYDDAKDNSLDKLSRAVHAMLDGGVSKAETGKFKQELSAACFAAGNRAVAVTAFDQKMVEWINATPAAKLASR